MKSKLQGYWIWFWYNDYTRFIIVLFGGHLIVLIPILAAFGLDGYTIKTISMWAYIIVFFWAMLDNDYSNLNKIGLDVYRKPLKPKPNLDKQEPK